MTEHMIAAVPKVYIVLLNWNGWDHSIECLESVLRSDFRNYQVVVVDNGSTDESVEAILAWSQGRLCSWTSPGSPMRQYSQPPFGRAVSCVRYHSQEVTAGGDRVREAEAYAVLPPGLLNPVILIEAGRNLGFGSGNNVALKYVTAKGDADYVWLLNNDTVVEPSALSEMVKTAQRGAGITGAVVKRYYAPEQIEVYGGGYLSSFTGRNRAAKKMSARPLDFVAGVSFMIDRATLSRVGFFDEAIFMYFEENEYCLRARKHQVRMAVSDAVVYHKGGASRPSSFFQWKSVYDGKTYTFLKHFGIGPWVLGVAVMWGINIVVPGVDRDKKRASRDALYGLYKAFVRR